VLAEWANKMEGQGLVKWKLLANPDWRSAHK